jgi:hypothetical protein
LLPQSSTQPEQRRGRPRRIRRRRP